MATTKAILVHLQSHQDWSPSIDAAIGLAGRFGATLTGLYTNREIAMLKLALGADHRTVSDAAARVAPGVEAMRGRFLEACTRAGVEARFEYGEGNANELLSLVGRCQDLVVIEQSAGGLDGLGADPVEECAVACGTPTLMVPKSGDFARIGKCIGVAWNHSRQAAAALHGALPLIASAERVVVLLGKERDALPSVTKRPAADVGNYLRHYASDVVIRPFADAAQGGNLQAAALDAGADLLVMGAYGRSAWREFVFGGTTREVVADLRLPVLMAH